MRTNTTVPPPAMAPSQHHGGPQMPVPAQVNSYQQPMYDVEAPHQNDVLSGRGVTTNRHEGNTNFRSLVALNKELYVTSTKRQKMSISRSIVEAVRSMTPPGRFLEKNPITGLWSDIGDRKAIEKTSQALRDGAASLRKQLSQDLGDPDFLSAVFDVDEKATAKDKPAASSSGSDATSAEDAAKSGTDAKSGAAVSGSASSAANTSATTTSGTKEKTKPIKAKTVKKGHRRTRSNPDSFSVAKKRISVKKPKSSSDIMGSPRSYPPKSGKSPLSPHSQPASPMDARRMMTGISHPGAGSFDLAENRFDADHPYSAPYPPESPASPAPMTVRGRSRSLRETIGYHGSMFRDNSLDAPPVWTPPRPPASSARSWPQKQSPRHFSSGHTPLSPPPGRPSAPSGSPLPPGRHQLSPGGYEYSSSSPMSSLGTGCWTPNSFTFGQSTKYFPGWGSPMCFPGYSDGDLDVPALSRHDRSTPSPMPMSPRSTHSSGGNMYASPTIGAKSARGRSPRPNPSSPHDFAPPPPSPRRGGPGLGKTMAVRGPTVCTSSSSSTKENYKYGASPATAGSGTGSPTVVVNHVLEDESRSDSQLKSEVEVIWDGDYRSSYSERFERDMTEATGDDPAREKDDGEESPLSPLPLESSNQFAMEISDDLLQMPIAPFGPHDNSGTPA